MSAPPLLSKWRSKFRIWIIWVNSPFKVIFGAWIMTSLLKSFNIQAPLVFALKRLFTLFQILQSCTGKAYISVVLSYTWLHQQAKTVQRRFFTIHVEPPSKGHLGTNHGRSSQRFQNHKNNYFWDITKCPLWEVFPFLVGPLTFETLVGMCKMSGKRSTPSHTTWPDQAHFLAINDHH